MAEPQRREFQTFKRAEKCRATVSKGSALAMEIKRKKMGEGAVFLEQREGCVQDKIDLEVRIREGICKLLAVSTQKDQVLTAVKNLMTCNARIQAYMSVLQIEKQEEMETQVRRRSCDIGSKERAACTGKVAISDIRIPLLWKNSDHFSNKESSQHYAVFCMFTVGTTVFDTDLVIVDKTMTDLSFENVTIFDEVRPDFEMKMEVYSCCVEEPFSANTPKKIVHKLRRSIGKASGKKLNSQLEGTAPSDHVMFNPPKCGTKYGLLAHTTLTLESAENSFTTHSFVVTGREESSFWLPLYGSVSCRVVAQPTCLTADVIAGFLNHKQIAGSLCSLKRMFCVLRGVHMLCYSSSEEIEANVVPLMQVPINKETRIRAVDKGSVETSSCLSIVNPVAGEAMTHVFVADSSSDLQRWMEAFWQHFYDLSQWKHCSEELMKIKSSPRKPLLFLTKEATSVYHDMSIGSPLKIESLTDTRHKDIDESDKPLQTCSQGELPHLPWSLPFDSSHLIHVQKNQVLDEKERKKRAPLPPSGISQRTSNSQENSKSSDKENVCRNTNYLSHDRG